MLFLLVPILDTANAQAITNAGKDFWFGFTEPVDATDLAPPNFEGNIVFQANISSNTSTSGFIEIPGSPFFETFTVVPGQVTKVVIPDSLAWISTSEVLEPQAVHIKTVDDCVVYSNTYHSFRSEASLVLPYRALGVEYAVITSEPIEKIRSILPQIWRSEFLIVSPGETVTVEITPSAPTLGGHAANVPFQVSLDSGDVYQVQGDSLDDLTGSRIRCIDPDKRVAVFAGNVWATSYCGNTADPVYEALFPVESWGKAYTLLPTPRVGIDAFRVIAKENNTNIYKDGTLLTTLNQGEFYQDTHQVARLISGDKPISVGQLMISGNACGNIFPGDPSMVMINPNEQMFLDSITFFAVSEVQIDSNYVVIATRTADTATLELDGNPVSGFKILQGDTNISHTFVLIDTGSHTLNTSGCGFVAYSIGLGNAESYSYAAGVRLTNLEGGVNYDNISANSDTICQYDSLKFTVSANGNPFEYTWDFGNGATSSLAEPVYAYDSAGTYYTSVIIKTQCGIDTVLDTLTIIDLPRFELGNDTVICLQNNVDIVADTSALSYLWKGGSDNLSLNVDSTDTYWVTCFNTRCAFTDSIHIEFRPTVNSFSITPLDSTDTICDGEPLRFSAFTSREVLGWLWNFGDGSTDTSELVVRSYSNADNYTVTLQAAYLCGQDTLTDLFESSVSIIQTPQLSLPDDTISCVKPITLKAEPRDNGYQYSWNPDGIKGYENLIENEGVYYLEANNEGCIDRDSINVTFTNEFILPNVITPNFDGINDVFYLKATKACHDYDELVIYNRWGQLIFETNRPFSERWDAHTPAGELVENGTYFYILSGNGGEHAGTVTVLAD